MRKVMLAMGTVVLTGMLSMPVLALDARDIVGMWYINSMTMDEVSINPANMGMEATMEFSKDGTVIMEMTGEDTTNGTWEIDGDSILVLTEDVEKPDIFSYEDEKLSAEEDGMGMVFGREPMEAEAYDPGAVVAAPELTDFDGTWTATWANIFGMEVPIDIVEIEMKVVIENGAGTISYNDGFEEIEAPLEGSLNGDTLTLTNPEADEDGFYIYFDPNILNLKLHENGCLSFSNRNFSADGKLEVEESKEESDEEDAVYAIYFEK